MLTAKLDIDNGFKLQKESFLNEDASHSHVVTQERIKLAGLPHRQAPPRPYHQQKNQQHREGP